MTRFRHPSIAAGAMLTSAVLTFPAGALAGPSPAPLDPDATFAGDGTLIIEIAQRDLAYTGVIEESGEIVVIGESDNGSPSTREAIFQRILADGTPGLLTRLGASAFGCTVPRTFRSGLRLSDGDYVGGGYVQQGCGGIPRYFNAFRLSSAGAAVDEFDRVPFNNQLAYIGALGEQSDGTIIAAGFASGSGSDNATFDIAVARFTAAGDLDPTFGSGGVFTFDGAGDQDWANDVVVDDADRILIAGFSRSAQGDQEIAVLRLTPDGSLDSSFNGSGIFLFDGSGFNDVATSIDLAPGGRILVGGGSRSSTLERDAVVLALTDDGALDPVFANGGIATVDFGQDDAVITALEFDAWRIYVTGFARPAGAARVEIDAAVGVLRANGSPNPFFNGGSSRVFVFDPALGAQSDLPQSIAVSSDGEQIVVTGYTDNEARTIQRFGIARFVGLENALFIDGFEGSAR